MKRALRVAAIVLVALLVSSTTGVAARSGDGPPYDGSAVVNHDHACTNANVCTSVGEAEAATGRMAQHTTVDIGGGADDGSAWSFVVREVTDATTVPDGWPKATVTVTFELEEASAALTGTVDPEDEAEGYVWASVAPSGCPSCGASTRPLTLARHRAGTGVGPSVEALAPGKYSLTFATNDAYDGSKPTLGTLTVRLRHLTRVIVARQQYDNAGDAFGLFHGPAPQRRAEVSTRLTVTSISVRRAAAA